MGGRGAVGEAQDAAAGAFDVEHLLAVQYDRDRVVTSTHIADGGAPVQVIEEGSQQGDFSPGAPVLHTRSPPPLWQ